MPTISQRIALDGAPDFKAAFGEIAKAGADAFSSLKAAGKDIGLDKDLTPQLARAKKAAQDFGDGFNNAFKAIGDTVQDFANASAKITAGVTAIGAALIGLARHGADAAASVKEAAIAAGESTQNWQKLAFGFETTGIGADKLTRVFATINAAVAKAGEQGKESADKFEKFGIRLRETDGSARGASAILADVADKMKALPNATDRAAFAVELFGRRVGPQMVELLSRGSDGIRELGADAERLGIILSDADTKAGKDFNTSLVRLGGTVSATSTKFGLLFAPAFASAANALADAFAKLQGPILAAGAAIAEGLAPYVKDIVAALTGHGAEIQTGFVYVSYQAFSSLATLVRATVMPVIEGWIAILRQVGPTIDAMFGAGFSAHLAGGAAAAVGLAIAFGTLLKSVQLLAGGFGLFLRLAGLGASLSPVGLAIIAIVTAIGLLIVVLSKVDWVGFAARAAAAWNAIVDGAKSAIAGMAEPFVKFFDGLIDGIKGVIGWFEKLLGLQKQSGATAGAGVAGAAGAVTAAGGGHVTGPGTSTSDSINARLSHGEFVQRAAAVSHYGVGFMHAVNQMRLPRFALGGLFESLAISAPRLAPVRMAAGGPVQAGSTVNLAIDGRRFVGLSGPDHVVQSLKHYAIGRRTSATGRKPSWYR